MEGLIETFATLHKGGAVAECHPDGGVRPQHLPTGDPLPAHGSEFHQAVELHLEGSFPIGVYPLRRGGNDWVVNWLAVDLDEGDSSFVHACNLQLLFERLTVVSFIEASRSKGYHVWVYVSDPVSATVARRAMIGACRTVGVPTRECYPKQTELHGKGFGNCLRLPYPGGSDATQRQCMVRSDHTVIPFGQFLHEAWDGLNSRGAIRRMLPLYESTQPKNTVEHRRLERTDEDFGWHARAIWNETDWADRSRSLVSFAGSLFRQGYSESKILDLLYRMDDKMGKYAGRPDRDVRLREIVAIAVKEGGHAT